MSHGSRTFLSIWLGQTISIIGSGLTDFALAVWVYQQTGRATPFALAIFCSAVPAVLLAPLAGSLADRWNRRRLMLLADTGSALITLIVAALVFLNRLEVWQVFLMAGLNSAFSSLQEPAYTAAITTLVPPKDLARANGLVQLSQAARGILTPALAGFLYYALGLSGVLVIDFSTFLIALSLMLAARIPQPRSLDADTETKKSVWRDFRLGWQYLRSRPGLFWLLWYRGLINFAANYAAVLIGPMVLAFATTRALGLLETMMGAGMVLGSLTISIWGGSGHRVRLMIQCAILTGIGLALAGVRADVFLIGIGLFAAMFGVPINSSQSQALMQTLVPPSLQGRVFAVRAAIVRSMMPLAYLTAGPIHDKFFAPLMAAGGPMAGTPIGWAVGTGPGRGAGLIMLLCGLFLVLASAAVWLHPKIRRIEADTVPWAVERPVNI